MDGSLHKCLMARPLFGVIQKLCGHYFVFVYEHLPTFSYMGIFCHEHGQKWKFFDHTPTSPRPRSC